jgi:transcriptional regulator with XRE-family HTH domain
MCCFLKDATVTLADWMTLKRLTDADLAALVAADRSRINRIRRGVAVPSLALARRIKDATQGAVTADDYAD